MGLILLIIGIALVAVPGTFANAGRKLEPVSWARLCIACITGGWIIIEGAALLYAVPSLLATIGGPRIDELCYRMIGQFAPGGPIAAAVLAVVAIALPFRTVQASRRMHRARQQVVVDPSIGSHTAIGGYDLVILAAAEPIAYSVRAPAAQIVVSTTTTSCLTESQLNTVIRHEKAHLDHHHQAYLSAAGAADASLGWVPLVRPSTAELRLALERWADEIAAGTPPQRRVLHDALATVATTVLTPAVTGLSSLDTLTERLNALRRPAVAPSSSERIIALLPVAIVAGGLTTIVALWHSQLLMMIALISHCPN